MEIGQSVVTIEGINISLCQLNMLAGVLAGLTCLLVFFISKQAMKDISALH